MDSETTGALSVPNNPAIDRVIAQAGELLSRAHMCRAAGVAPPDFAATAGAAVVTFRVAVAAGEVRPGSAGEVTAEVTEEVARLLTAMTGAMKRQEMQVGLGLKHEEHFREAYLVPALSAGLSEMTIPDKPTSRLQKYRLTDRGRAWLAGSRSR